MCQEMETERILNLIRTTVRRVILEQSTKFSTLHGNKFILDLDSIDLMLTTHGEERTHRHAKQIDRGAIVKAIDAATSDFMTDFANGELRNGDRFIIRANDGKGETLNIVATLNMRPGRDFLYVITVMRKNRFKTTEGEVLEYEVKVG